MITRQHLILALMGTLILGIALFPADPAALGMIALGAGMVSQIANGILSGFAGALMVVYFVAIIASAHRQLSGPSPEAISQTFE